MALIPLVEIALRPMAGSGIDNAPVVVQHLGLAVAMLGSAAALRNGHLSTFGNVFQGHIPAGLNRAGQIFATCVAGVVCGVLCAASWRLVVP